MNSPPDLLTTLPIKPDYRAPLDAWRQWLLDTHSFRSTPIWQRKMRQAFDASLDLGIQDLAALLVPHLHQAGIHAAELSRSLNYAIHDGHILQVKAMIQAYLDRSYNLSDQERFSAVEVGVHQALLLGRMDHAALLWPHLAPETDRADFMGTAMHAGLESSMTFMLSKVDLTAVARSIFADHLTLPNFKSVDFLAPHWLPATRQKFLERFPDHIGSMPVLSQIQQAASEKKTLIEALAIAPSTPPRPGIRL